jgi:hypothetical protein
MIKDGIHFIGVPSALAQETRPPTSNSPTGGENLSSLPGSEDSLTSPVAGEEQESASRSALSVSRNWSGYFEWNGKGTFKQETAYFIEPFNKGDSCTKVGTAIWGGLGGNYEGAALGQDGTEQGNSGVVEEHLAWFEVLPEGPKPVTPRLHATPGSYFLAATEYKGSGEYSFYEYNYHTHNAARGIAHGKFDGNVADYIVERLGEYGLVNVGSVTMQGFTNNKAFGQGLTERVIMRNAAGETNAQPGAIINKYEFHDKYEHCPGSSPKKGRTEEEGALPVATTNAASSVTETTATLNGSVNPEGHETGYAFEYGTEAENYSASTPEFEAGSGLNASEETTAISGLQPGTTYHYRIIANSTTGIAAGEDKTFTTPGTSPPPPPAVTTERAKGVIAHAATLEASVNPNGADTHYYFEYGTNSGLYEMYAPAIPGNDAGSGSVPEHVGVRVNELTPNTTYYYRWLPAARPARATARRATLLLLRNTHCHWQVYRRIS